MSRPMKPDDPAYWMLEDDFTTTPTIHREGCYICEDPEFARMGLPLCTACLLCGGHVAADDEDCDDCGESQRWLVEQPQGELLARSEVTCVST